MLPKKPPYYAALYRVARRCARVDGPSWAQPFRSADLTARHHRAFVPGDKFPMGCLTPRRVGFVARNPKAPAWLRGREGRPSIYTK